MGEGSREIKRDRKPVSRSPVTADNNTPPPRPNPPSDHRLEYKRIRTTPPWVFIICRRHRVSSGGVGVELCCALYTYFG